jgi:predicted Zn-dependent protease
MWSRAELLVGVVAIATALVGGASPVAGQSRRALADLGRLDPPAYTAPLVRRGAASEGFDAAMDAYGRRQYERAADLLRRFVAADADDPAANFFLALSLMMTDEVGEAEDRARAVLSAGESSFTLPARFVLAKALIRLGRLADAEHELIIVAGREGPYRAAAGELLPRLRAVKQRE